VLEIGCSGSHEIGCVGERPPAREISRERQAAGKRNRRREREPASGEEESKEGLKREGVRRVRERVEESSPRARNEGFTETPSNFSN